MSQETPSHPVSNAYAGYWDRAQWPLQGLYFLLPLLVLYEIGTLMGAPEGSERLPPILAESVLGIGFEKLGITGVYLPAIIVLVVLFCMHLVRRDPWRPEPKLYAVMWFEAIVWALPLFVFSLILVRELSEAGLQVVAGTGSEAGWNMPLWLKDMVFSVGAGIYEELLFRLIGIALLHMLLVDVLALPEKYGGGGAIVITALAFALYHFVISNPDAWSGYAFKELNKGLFAFYFLAGIYLAMIYVTRGFGLVVGTHALYDIFVAWHNHDLTGQLFGVG